MSAIDAFWTNGFAIVRDVFAPAEVARIRARAAKHNMADLFALPELRELILDDRVLAIARAILGEGELVYFGDSNALVGDTAPGFHRDNADKADGRAPDWDGRYPIIRFGLYTEEYAAQSGGLDLRRGTHADIARRGEYVAADTRVGDLVVWNLRILHSGNTMRLISGAAVDPGSTLGKILRRWPLGIVRPPPEPRVALFWTYAKPGPHLDRYIAYLKTRRYALERWLAASYSPQSIAAAAAKNVSVLSINDDVRPEQIALANPDHVPLAY